MRYSIRFISILIIIFIVSGISLAEDIQMGSLNCGDIIENEFRANSNRHIYTINLGAGDVVDILGEPLGDNLDTRFVLTDPAGNLITRTNANPNTSYFQAESRPHLISSVLSASGEYTFSVLNSTYQGQFSAPISGGIGVYTLYVTCTLRNGTVIEPGVPELNPDPPQSVPTQVFTGFGFPGLNPVDFGVGVTLPLTMDIPNPGSISDGFAGIFGYTFEAGANEAFNLQFNRVAGNLNLNLVVLSANNEVVFQSSLISTNQLNADFSTLSAGQYTIGVSLMDLSPPSNPEVTQFQIMLTR